VEPFLNRAVSERYQPVEAFRRGQTVANDFYAPRRDAARPCPIVITGLVPVIPITSARRCKTKRDGRDKPCRLARP